MRKTLILWAVLGDLILIAEAKSDREEAGLHGPVKSVMIEEGRWKSGQWAGSTLKEAYSYDEGGWITEGVLGYYIGGKLKNKESRYVYKYSTDHRTQETFSVDEDGSQKSLMSTGMMIVET